MSTSPIIAQLARFEPSGGAKPWVIKRDDTNRIINSGTTVDLFSTPQNFSVEFSSRVTFEYWVRLNINAAPGAGIEQLIIDAFAVIDGVTTLFNYPLRHRGGVTGDILRVSGWADTSSFIHPQNTIVTYGMMVHKSVAAARQYSPAS